MISLWHYLAKRNSIASIAARNEKNYQKWLNDHNWQFFKHKPDMRRVYTDAHGNNYYINNDPLALSQERAHRTQEAIAAAEYNLSKPDLVAGFSRIIEACNAVLMGDVSQASEALKVATDMKQRSEELGVEKLVMELAVMFFFIDGENPETVNELVLQKKRDLAATDDYLRAFFLKTTWDAFNLSTSIAGDGFLKYLARKTRKK